MQIRINLSYPHFPTPIKFVLNNKVYTSLRIPYQPVFSNSQQIVLNSNNAKVTESLLTLLTGETNSVDIKLLADVVKLGKQIFNVDLEIDYDDFACNMIHEISEKDKQVTVEVLDNLPLTGIIKVIEMARLHYTDKSTEDVLNKLAEAYIKFSKRPQHEKSVLGKRILQDKSKQNKGKQLEKQEQQELEEEQEDEDEEKQQEQDEQEQDQEEQVVEVKKQNYKQNKYPNQKIEKVQSKTKNSKYYEQQIQKLVQNKYQKDSTKDYQKNSNKKYQKNYEKNYYQKSYQNNYPKYQTKNSDNYYEKNNNKKYNKNKSQSSLFDFNFQQSPKQKYNNKEKYGKQDYTSNKYDKNQSKGYDIGNSFKTKQSYESQAKNEVTNTQQMISLAIFGQSTQNWRERSRPYHYKSQQYVRQYIPKALKPQVSQKSNREKQPPKVFDLPAGLSSKKLFTYPHEGSTFKFNEQLLPFSIFIQPQNITIEFYQSYLILKLQNKKAFKRNTKYAFVENGIVCQGISLLLHGVSLIEDGGQQIIKGDNQNLSIINQWFYIQQATICKLS